MVQDELLNEEECNHGRQIQEDDDDDDNNPLNFFLYNNNNDIETLFQDDSSPPKSSSSKTTTATTKSIRQHRRDWGIPTFQDQMDRGITSFFLTCEYIIPNSSNNISNNKPPPLEICLEHRAHSTGSDLWDAALVLCHALALNRPGLMDIQQSSSSSCSCFDWTSKTVLELGSGTGAMGLFVAHFLQAKHVILTDLPGNLPLIQRNTAKNNKLLEEKRRIHICPLDWTEYETLPDYIQHYPTPIHVILGSDLFLPYATHLLKPLAQLLAKLLRLQQEKVLVAATRIQSSSSLSSITVVEPPPSPPSPPMALICYEERFDPCAFFQQARLLHLNVQPVDDVNLLHDKYRDPERIHLLRITLEEY